MKKNLFFASIFLLCNLSFVQAQNKLSIDKVYSAYLRNSGSIMEKNQIKGYFFLYQSDKIDKRTNEYTLQVLDQNLNKVREIKFEDSKQLNLLEASYNGNSLAFLFKNADNKTLDMKIYSLDGKLQYTYSSAFDKRTEDLMNTYATLHTDEGTNQNVFDVDGHGYVSVLPLRDGKQRTYSIVYYSSEEKKQWTYQPQDDEERFTTAEYLGGTDSLILLLVTKKDRMLSGKLKASLVGVNFKTRKKAFELEDTDDKYVHVPTTIVPGKEKGQIIVIGSYFIKGDDIAKDFSKGLAVLTINSDGKILNKVYNSWVFDFGKYLSTNNKGKIDKIGYLYIHKVIQTPDGKSFVVSEGYKRQASAGGIAATVLLGAMGARSSAIGVTKIVVTDLVLMELDKDYKVSNAGIYDKETHTVDASSESDFTSQHQIAMAVKMVGGFDYEFTTGEVDNSNFTVCYSNYESSADYKGQTFNAIRFNGAKFTTDKIPLKSKASKLKVFPAKPGSVMIMEYFKKEKRLDFRLEKLG
ncbi:MAG: DUF6770 family protein [Ginsengibacter sp.]